MAVPESRALEDAPAVERTPALCPARLVRSPARAVLALQRTIGNAATARLLARSPRPDYQHAADNPVLRDTVYIARDLALRDFVNMYHEMELLDLTDPAEREKVIAATRIARRAQITRLGERITRNQKELDALTDPARPKKVDASADELQQEKQRGKDLARALTQDAATIKRLEREIAEKSSAKAWNEAVEWEAAHYSDPMAGADLMKEVKRLFATSKVPAWLKPLVIDYAGMRYHGLAKARKDKKGNVVKDKKGNVIYDFPSAHGSYYSPVRLLYIVRDARGELAGNRAAQRAAGATSPEAAVAELERLHDAGEIPAWAWHKIVRLTELRTWYAEVGWEDESKELPGSDAGQWPAIMERWTSTDPIDGVALAYGATGWRGEMNRRNALVTTRMFCNELSEAAQRQRGIELPGKKRSVGLPGGIEGNAVRFEEIAAAAAEPGAAASVAGSYFRQATSESDIRPGASLFFIEGGKWATAEPNTNMVRAVAGATYPMPDPPEYSGPHEAWEKATKAYEREKKAWDERAAKATTPAKTAKLGAAPEDPKLVEPTKPEVLPGDGKVVDGWAYTVKPGEPITRQQEQTRLKKGEKPDGETETVTVTQWMQWKHQATVLAVMPGGRVFTLETTDNLPGEGTISSTGFRVRKLDSLLTRWVFVGYAPGTAAAAGVAAPAPAPAPAGGSLEADDEPIILDDEEPIILDDEPALGGGEAAVSVEAQPYSASQIDDAKLLELLMGAFTDGP